MRLVYDNDDIAARRQKRVSLAFRPTELLNKREDQPLVLTKELSHLLAVLWLCGFRLSNGPGVQEVAIDLSIQVLAVSDHHKSEIARLFAENLPRIKDHREALT